MTAERKYTMGVSYLRSAFSDICLVRPSLRSDFVRILKLLADHKPDFVGKCYNIRLKK